jgi:hypothetical protein
MESVELSKVSKLSEQLVDGLLILLKGEVGQAKPIPTFMPKTIIFTGIKLLRTYGMQTD